MRQPVCLRSVCCVRHGCLSACAGAICSSLRLNPAAQRPCGSALRLSGPCCSADPAAQRTLRLNRPRGSADPAAQRTLRLRGPCGSADRAAQRTLCGSADPAAQRTPTLFPAAPRTLRLSKPCGSANPAAQQTLRLSKPWWTRVCAQPAFVLSVLCVFVLSGTDGLVPHTQAGAPLYSLQTSNAIVTP